MENELRVRDFEASRCFLLIHHRKPLDARREGAAYRWFARQMWRKERGILNMPSIKAEEHGADPYRYVGRTAQLGAIRLTLSGRAFRVYGNDPDLSDDLRQELSTIRLLQPRVRIAFPPDMSRLG